MAVRVRNDGKDGVRVALPSTQSRGMAKKGGHSCNVIWVLVGDLLTIVSFLLDINFYTPFLFHSLKKRLAIFRGQPK